MHSYRYRIKEGRGDRDGFTKLLRDGGLKDREFELWEAAEILAPEMDYSASASTSKLIDLIRQGYLIEV